MQTIGLLADAASPVALFTIGAVLARSQMVTATEHACRCADYVPVGVIKLVLHPLLVLVVGTRRDRPGRAARPLRADGDGAGRGAAQRQQRRRCWPNASAPTPAASRASSC